VLVWIHGGSNRAGGPNDIVLSDVGKEVVIVGIRYRLGIFGFLSHPALTAEQGASGNYGIMDQIAALRWVQRNIAKFGGDPANVTIAGESAGSQDVSLLLAAPQARGLFRKAIMESGTPGFGMEFRAPRNAGRRPAESWRKHR
jgi:para-nitrobenzyl esterase